MDWVTAFRSGVLEKCSKNCTSIGGLADAISKDSGNTVTVDALVNAHRRHKTRLNLKPSLMDYMLSKAPRVRPEDIEFPVTPERHKALAKAKRFVITSALNNCPIDGKIWDALLAYAEEHKAEIIVIPSRYKNPTSQRENQSRDAWWPSELHPYMADDLIEIHPDFWIMANVRVQATAVHPITGLEGLSKSASACFGHAQLALKMVPTPQNASAKILYTTGSVSQSKYSVTKAGVRGEFHHGLGGLVVELDGDRFHVRALVGDADGGFYDIDRYYTGKGSKKSTNALALVTGDEHAIFVDPDCKRATYSGKKSIVGTCQPEKIVRHDVFDGYSIGHHGRKDPVKQIAKHESGLHSLQHELDATLKHVIETTPDSVENLIVSSNHHDHLMQWLKETTPIEEPWNARLWHKLWGFILDSLEMGKGGAECCDPFAEYAKRESLKNTTFLEPDSGEMIAGVSVGLHGHRGSNGSRGSLKQFSRLGVKTIVGHSHTPGICHGAYQVGTSSHLQLEYTGGPSSWAHCHCLIHPNGKRQLIFIVDGHWRA